MPRVRELVREPSPPGWAEGERGKVLEAGGGGVTAPPCPEGGVCGGSGVREPSGGSVRQGYRTTPSRTHVHTYTHSHIQLMNTDVTP